MLFHTSNTHIYITINKYFRLQFDENGKEIIQKATFNNLPTNVIYTQGIQGTTIIYMYLMYSS